MTVQEKTTPLSHLQSQIKRMSLEDQLDLLELLSLKSYQEIKRPDRVDGFIVFPLKELENQFKELSETDQNELLKFLFAEARETASKIVMYIAHYDKDYYEALNYNLATSERFNPDDYEYDDDEVMGYTTPQELPAGIKPVRLGSAYNWLANPADDLYSLEDGEPFNPADYRESKI